MEGSVDWNRVNAAIEEFARALHDLAAAFVRAWREAFAVAAKAFDWDRIRRAGRIIDDEYRRAYREAGGRVGGRARTSRLRRKQAKATIEWTGAGTKLDPVTRAKVAKRIGRRIDHEIDPEFGRLSAPKA